MIILNPLEFLRAIGGLIKAAWRRERLLVQPEVARYRGEECQKRWGGCYHGETGQCRVCSCFIGAKMWLATEECPSGFWKKELIRTDLGPES